MCITFVQVPQHMDDSTSDTMAENASFRSKILPWQLVISATAELLYKKC